MRLVWAFLLVVIVFSLQVSSQRSGYSRYGSSNSSYPSYGRSSRSSRRYGGRSGGSSRGSSWGRSRSSASSGRYSSRYSTPSYYDTTTTTTTTTRSPYSYGGGGYAREQPGYGRYESPPSYSGYSEYAPSSTQNASFYAQPDLLSYLPKSVRDWFENTAKQVGDMASEIVKSKEKTVVEFVDNTLREGEKLVTDIFDEVTREVFNKTRDSEDALMNTISDFERKVANIPESMRLIWARDAALNGTETDQNKDDLDDIKKKLKDFEEKVKKETETEKDLPLAMRNQLIKLITASRGIMNEIGNEDEKMWSKLKLMEKEMFQFQLTFAETSEDLKKNLNSLFDALKKVALPKLKSVSDAEQFKSFINKLLYE